MFLKFGSEENIIDLYENGTIFMNSREYFRKIEDKELRGDSYEGVKQIKNYGAGSFLIPQINHVVNYQNIHLPIHFGEVWGNIYSVYAIDKQTTPEMFNFKMDERNINFGTHCLVIKDPNLFINEMIEKFIFLNFKYYLNFVKYFDKKSFNGALSVFDKPIEFKYQKEFRFYVERVGIDPLKFHLNNIKSYTEIYKSEQIMDIKLVPPKKGD